MALVLAVAELEGRVSFHCWAQSRWCQVVFLCSVPRVLPSSSLGDFSGISLPFPEFLYFEIVSINQSKFKKKSLYSVFGLEKRFSFLYILIEHWSVYYL